MTIDRLTVRHHVADDGTVELHVAGDVDAASSPALSAALDQATQEGSSVRIDLAQVPFMDSSGIGAIVTAHRRLLDEGGALGIVGITRAVRRAFDHAGLSDHLSPPAPDAN